MEPIFLFSSIARIAFANRRQRVSEYGPARNPLWKRVRLRRTVQLLLDSGPKVRVVCCLERVGTRRLPALVDTYGSALHPIVALTTLIWGIVDGIKVSVLISLLLEGVAQWWIARELRLGWIPRLWSAGIAVAGGQLSGRMDTGVFSVLLSTSMCSLLLAGVLRLGRRGGRRTSILVGVLFASVSAGCFPEISNPLAFPRQAPSDPARGIKCPSWRATNYTRVGHQKYPHYWFRDYS